MTKFIGNFNDLENYKSESFDGKRRYSCPYCHTIHGKSHSDEACVIFDMNSMFGRCFRCDTFISSDGLMDASYIRKRLDNSENFNIQKILKEKVPISWLKSALEDEDAFIYLRKRNITVDSIKKFDILCMTHPVNAIAFYNKRLDEENSDYLYMRGFNNDEIKHNIIKDLTKKASWLHLAESNNLLIVEGFFDAVASYQHCLNSGVNINPIVLSGKTISDYQIDEINRWVTTKKDVIITICMDGGFFEDTLKIADKVFQSVFNAQVFVMNLPYNKDANEINTETFISYFNNRLEYFPSKKQLIRNEVYNAKSIDTN